MWIVLADSLLPMDIQSLIFKSIESVFPYPLKHVQLELTYRGWCWLKLNSTNWTELYYLDSVWILKFKSLRGPVVGKLETSLPNLFTCCQLHSLALCSETNNTCILHTSLLIIQIQFLEALLLLWLRVTSSAQKQHWKVEDGQKDSCSMPLL